MVSQTCSGPSNVNLKKVDNISEQLVVHFIWNISISLNNPPSTTSHEGLFVCFSSKRYIYNDKNLAKRKLFYFGPGNIILEKNIIGEFYNFKGNHTNRLFKKEVIQ